MSIIDARNAKALLLRLLMVVGLVSGAVLPISQGVIAAPQDYRFELVNPPRKSGKVTVITVRLIHIPDGKPVVGAIITRTKYDMPSDKMSASAKAAPTADAGTFEIKAELSMEGKWTLSLSARVQGETEIIRGTVTVEVPK